MHDWNQLHHAYGPAVDIPALLDQLTPDPDAEVWSELWSTLCHQGTVYSASFAALPTLENAARQWQPRERLMPLALAGAIIGSRDVECDREDSVRGLAPVIDSLRALLSEALTAPGWPKEDFIYLLQAARAFEGDPVWGSQLDGLVQGELAAFCPGCQADLYLVIGASGFHTVAQEWIDRPDVERIAITPCTGTSPKPGDGMVEQARAAGQQEIATWLSYVFGASRCPACGEEFSLPEAVALLVL